MIMAKANQILDKQSVPSVIAHAVAMTWFIAAVMFIMSSCQRKPVMAHAGYLHLPLSGWLHTSPLTFVPEYDDSTATYELSLAVRHDNSYAYRNLCLTVDIINADSVLRRKTVDMTLADEYGNWKGGGFGSLYQNVVSLERNVGPADACSVVVWQTMAGCDTLYGVTDVGIFAHPSTKN